MFSKGASICYLIMGVVWLVITSFGLHLTSDFAKFLKFFIQGYAVGVLIGGAVGSLIKGK